MAPVLFIIFSRPDTTRKVFDAIRTARPPKLYIAADGPRPERGAAEVSKVMETRSIVSEIDWPCEVFTLFREENLGCKRAVSSAITWFFQHEAMGIILEDDCLPAPDFFPFATEMLAKYANDESVWHINGSNYQNGWQRNKNDSYYFSRYNSIWGWASWARAWSHYNVDIPDWPHFKDSGRGLELSASPAEYLLRAENLDKVYYNGFDTWDFQWSFAIWKSNAKCITPNVNLISNIGFGIEATHTSGTNPRANLPTAALRFPLSAPANRNIDTVSDARHFRRHMRRGIRWHFRHAADLLKLSLQRRAARG